MPTTKPYGRNPHPHPLNPVEGTLSQLYVSVVGLEDGPSKLPLLIARDLEERFIRDGWPVGRVYGHEAELAAWYRVGRDVMREAVRILDARDCARMQRGPHGGLVVTKPRGAHLRDALGSFVHLTETSPAKILEAWSLLHAAAARLAADNTGGEPPPAPAGDDRASGGAAAQLRHYGRGLVARSGSDLLARLSDLLAPLLPPVCQSPAADRLGQVTDRIDRELDRRAADSAARRVRALFRGVEGRNLDAVLGSGDWERTLRPQCENRSSTPALEVVRRMMADVTPGEWTAGHPLGNELDLCERWRVDRSVIRQAIRIMEDAGTAITLPGRGHGLVTRRPHSASLSRQLCVFLASNSQDLADAETALDALLTEMAALSARRLQAADAPLLTSLFDSLDHLDKAAPISSVQPIERLQHRLAHNTLLSLLVDGVKAYLSWSMAEELMAPTWIMRVYADATREVLLAIGRHDAKSAALSEQAKLATLKRCRRIIVDPPPGPSPFPDGHERWNGPGPEHRTRG
ncbi:GntR family transcriptional regulator [Streptomyces sp. NPDC058464]|uniref:GntR family transcriptional regulator n=1 Tax=Streptomyces sp. NPDC058464 TaxID=3346511 RepID=UPI003648F22B